MSKRKAQGPSELDQDLKLIDDLTRALELFDSEKMRPEESLLTDARISGQSWKKFRGDGRASTEVFKGLVAAFQRVLESFMQMRDFCPDQLDDLIQVSLYAKYRELGEIHAARRDAKLTPKQRGELKRRLQKWKTAEIERIGELPMPRPFLKWLPWREPAVIFDKILLGKTVSQVELQDFFGVAAREFPKKTGPGKSDYRRVAQILDHLLNERSPKKGKERWYRDPDRRTRALNAMECKLSDPSIDERIAETLLAVVQLKR
jgi:hypothetical protein